MKPNAHFAIVLAGCVARAADTSGQPEDPPPPQDPIPGVNDLITGDWDCRTVGFAEGRLQGVAFNWSFTPLGLHSMDIGARVADAVNSGSLSRDNLQQLQLYIFVKYVPPDGFGGGDYYVASESATDLNWVGLGSDLVFCEWQGSYLGSQLLQVHPLADGTGGVALIPRYTDNDFVCYPASP